MEWVIVALLIGIVVLLLAVLVKVQDISNKQSDHDKHLASLYGEITDVRNEAKKKGAVTDPFQAANKSHTVGASSKHIIVRKTPDQIRAENFEKLKNGGQYGHPS